MYQEGSLTLGLFFAIESYPGAIPEMDVAQQIRTAQLAEAHNFGYPEFLVDKMPKM
ncbi:hypothetical protein SAMN05660691_04144 [Rheinheimera pacifica]|uniref:Uncharacterized protein n=2 Tax=Pseudomonadota TaxID=1224 RepID=A0A1H6NFF9_9GAMM|nr:hypothetical protein SAMN05660691_04144 [Rheinheimera pacifica]